MSFLEKSGSRTYSGRNGKKQLEQDIDEEWAYLWPIYQGVATKEEVNKATVKELQFLNGLANRKQEISANAIATALAETMVNVMGLGVL